MRKRRKRGAEATEIEVSGDLTVRVRAGRAIVEVGSPHGTVVVSLVEGGEDAPELAVALRRPEEPGRPVGDLEHAVDEAGSVTAKVERGLELFTAVAEGRILDPDFIRKEIDPLLGTLERLDREGHYREELRLARALVALLALSSRWVALVEALRAALRAAQALGDLHGQGWVHHEIGTLAIGADDATAANGRLEEALRFREAAGDRAGAAVTRRNLEFVRGAASTHGNSDRAPGRRFATRAVLLSGFAVLATTGTLAFATDIGREPDRAGASERTSTGPDKTATTETNGPGDRRAPRAEITNGPPDTTDSTSATFEFRADERAARFRCRLDDGPFEDCTTPQTYPGPLDAGPHAFVVRAVDTAGNRGEDTYRWTIEASPGPPVEIRRAPPSLTNSPTAVFLFAADGAAGFVCSLDKADPESCGPTRTYRQIGEGDHSLVVWAVDAADRQGPPSSHTWKVDRTPPTVEIGTPSWALDGIEAGTGTVTVELQANETSSLVCRLYDTPYSRVPLDVDHDCMSPKSYSPLDATTRYVLRVTPTDLAGNDGEEAVREIVYSITR